MNAVLQSVFPDRPPPSLPEGMRVLSDVDRLVDEMTAAGLVSVRVHKIEGIWRGGVGDAYIADTDELYRFMPAFAALGHEDEDRVKTAIRSYVGERAHRNAIELRTSVLIATGMQQ